MQEIFKKPVRKCKKYTRNPYVNTTNIQQTHRRKSKAGVGMFSGFARTLEILKHRNVFNEPLNAAHCSHSEVRCGIMGAWVQCNCSFSHKLIYMIYQLWDDVCFSIDIYIVGHHIIHTSVYNTFNMYNAFNPFKMPLICL